MLEGSEPQRFAPFFYPDAARSICDRLARTALLIGSESSLT